MQITIDEVGTYTPTMFDNVPRKIILPKIQRKHTQKTLNKAQRATIERYQAAYKLVYGVRPEVKVEGKWYRVHGSSAGVTRNRLKELATQLEYRAGS